MCKGLRSYNVVENKGFLYTLNTETQLRNTIATQRSGFITVIKLTQDWG